MQPRSAAVPLTVSSPELSTRDGSVARTSRVISSVIAWLQCRSLKPRIIVSSELGLRQIIELGGEAPGSRVDVALHRTLLASLSNRMPLMPRSSTSASSTLSTVSDENRPLSAIATG